MSMPKIVALCLGVLLWTVSPVNAQPPEPKPAETAQPAGDETITRAELVTDLDRIIANWESRMDTYVTKDEVNELRTLLLQLREELGETGEREGHLRTDVDGQDQRSKNTGRPGF
jgi:hypothetical protein